MSQVNISLLHRILPTLLEEDPALGADVRSILELADGVSGDAEENNFLSDSEVQAHLDTIVPETRRQVSILERNRDSMVGELQTSLRRLRARGGSPAISELLTRAAPMDGNEEELSAAEIAMVERSLNQMLEQNTPESIMGHARDLVGQMERLRRLRPEVFLPESQAAQEAAINLDFLRFLSPDEWQFIGRVMQGISSGSIHPNSDELSEQVRAAIEILELVNLAQIRPWENPLDLNGDSLALTWARYQAFRSEIPPEQDRNFPPASRHFADLRARAYRLWQGRMAELHPLEDMGIDVAPLANRGEALSDRLDVQTLLAAAGEDQILADWEAQLVVTRQQLLDGRAPDSPYMYMESAERLVGELGQFEFNVADHEIPTTPGDARTQGLNHAVLRDLAYMINGYSDYDSYLIENSFFSNLTHLAAYIGTHLFPPIALMAYGISRAADIEPRYEETDFLGGILPVFNPTYMQYARDGAETAKSQRAEAASFLAHLVGYNFSTQLEGSQIPPMTRRWASDPIFRAWLESRPEGEREASIPNALEFMRTYRDRHQAEVDRLMATGEYRTDTQARGQLFSIGWDSPNIVDRHYQVLTGPLCRLERLHEIRSITDRSEAEQAWLGFAQELEGRQWSFWGVHNTDGTGYWTDRPTGTAQWWYTRNPYFARTIYGALARQAGDETSRLAATQARQDSLGQDILDENGAIEESPWYSSNREGGSFGIVWPWRWFRNYSVENEDMGIENALTMIPVFRAGNIIARGVASARSSLPALGRGVLTFLGVGTAEAGGASSLGLARGAFSQWMQNLNRGLLANATREAGEAATQAAQQEVTQAVTRAAVTSTARPGFLTPFREALKQTRGKGMGAWAQFGFHSIRYAWEGIKNVGANVARRLRTSTLGQHEWVQFTGRTLSEFYARNALGLPRWLGGDLVRIGMTRAAAWLEPIAAQEGRSLYLSTVRTAHGALSNGSWQGAWQALRSTVTWNNFFSLLPGYWYHRSREAAPAVGGSSAQSSQTEDGRLVEDRRFRLGLPQEDQPGSPTMPALPTAPAPVAGDGHTEDDSDAGTLPEADMVFELGE